VFAAPKPAAGSRSADVAPLPRFPAPPAEARLAELPKPLELLLPRRAEATHCGACFTRQGSLERVGIVSFRHHDEERPPLSVAHFHQLPLWNPYECGGTPMIGDPQSRVLTPFFLIHLLFGPVVGIHLEIALHFALLWADISGGARSS